MRSKVRSRQSVFFAIVTEEKLSISTIQKYSKPIEKKLTVSATSGTPEELSAGIIPEYDRYITYHKKIGGDEFAQWVEEGMALWVDVEPKIDEEGTLVMEEDGITPVTPPDYRIEKILDTRKGKVARWGITKLGGNR